MKFETLDKFIVRKDKINGWKCDDIIGFEYWDVRYEIPELMRESMIKTTEFVAKKYGGVKEEISTGDAVSFFFHLKDKFLEWGAFEAQNLMSMTRSKQVYIPSKRAREFPQLVELVTLCDNDITKMNEVKKMKYGEVLDFLFGSVIKNEGKWNTDI